MEKNQKRPYYGRGTKREVVLQYQQESASAAALSEHFGIGGSNTVCRWAKEAGHSTRQPSPDLPMPPNKEVAVEKKNRREKRQRRYEQLRISELEAQLEEARQRVQLYALALEVISEEAGEDLLKKNGSTLSERRKTVGL